MSSLQRKAISLIGTVVAGALILPNLAAAQSQTTAAQIDQPNRVTIVYVAPENPDLQELYDLLKARGALEKIKGILGPLRLPEELTIKTAECRLVDAWYKRENFKPTITICYELLKHILESLPKETTPAGISPADATIGQFMWFTLHEVGRAVFDIFDVPIFGHEEDAADNFATYIMLQNRTGEARRLIGGAAWAWWAYMEDYRRNPVVRVRLEGFSNIHEGQVQVWPLPAKCAKFCVRLGPARVCGSFYRLRRGASAPDFAILCSLLQQHQNALVIG